LSPTLHRYGRSKRRFPWRLPQLHTQRLSRQ
jgi:hypothetical protein